MGLAFGAKVNGYRNAFSFVRDARALRRVPPRERSYPSVQEKRVDTWFTEAARSRRSRVADLISLEEKEGRILPVDKMSREAMRDAGSVFIPRCFNDS